MTLLATPWLIRHFGRRGAVAEATTDPRARYGFRLTESSRAAGLDFVHAAPTLDAKLAHIMPQVASMGAAVSVVDVDADGHADLYVTDSKEGSRNRLYRNRGDGTFEEIAAALGIAALNEASTGVSMGSAWGDYDNDGFPDLLLHRWGRQELFHNDGGKSLHAGERGGRPAGVGQHQHGDVAGLRSRRPTRLLHGRLLRRGRQSLEAVDHEDHAGELRVRDQRRPQVPVSQPRRRAVRGGQRRARARPRRAGHSRWWPPTCAAPAIPISSSPTTTACRSCFVNEGGRFREVGRADRRRLRAQERHERQRSATS